MRHDRGALAIQDEATTGALAHNLGCVSRLDANSVGQRHGLTEYGLARERHEVVEELQDVSGASNLAEGRKRLFRWLRTPTDTARRTRSCAAPIITASVPETAPLTLPLTGASMSRTPCSARAAFACALWTHCAQVEDDVAAGCAPRRAPVSLLPNTPTRQPRHWAGS